MKILGIETSCDETALAVIEAGGDRSPHFNVLKNVIASQIDVHKEYGGVVPGLAKREHTKNLIPVLYQILEVKSQKSKVKTTTQNSKLKEVEKILERYPEMLEEFKKKITPLEKPNINLIAVTHGPGLEPALWVGVNFARALSALWDIPLIGVDHMEGHIAVNLLQYGKSKFENPNTKQTPNSKTQITNIRMSRIRSAGSQSPEFVEGRSEKLDFPAVALAVSGGHTQLILVKNWMDYELLGETLDDAAGEAFDKVARMLELPFPGGPEIEKLAAKGNPNAIKFPRPMLNQKNYNFSFSGLKTAVLYYLRDKNMLNNDINNK